MCPACDPRQYALNFGQPLSWDISRVNVQGGMYFMFYVCSPPACPAPQSAIAPTVLHAACAAIAPLYTPRALTRQKNSLSHNNRFFIQCAWKSTLAFVIAGYGPGGSQNWHYSSRCP